MCIDAHTLTRPHVPQHNEERIGVRRVEYAQKLDSLREKEEARLAAEREKEARLDALRALVQVEASKDPARLISHTVASLANKVRA